MFHWWQLVGTRAIGGGPVHCRAALLAREGEDAKTGRIPICIGGKRVSGTPPHVFHSALASSSRLADAAADWTPSLTGAVAGVADSEDNAMTENIRSRTQDDIYGA